MVSFSIHGFRLAGASLAPQRCNRAPGWPFHTCQLQGCRALMRYHWCTVNIMFGISLLSVSVIFLSLKQYSDHSRTGWLILPVGLAGKTAEKPSPVMSESCPLPRRLPVPFPLPTPCPSQPLICFLSLHFSLGLYIKRVLQYVLFL